MGILFECRLFCGSEVHRWEKLAGIRWNSKEDQYQINNSRMLANFIRWVLSVAYIILTRRVIIFLWMFVLQKLLNLYSLAILGLKITTFTFSESDNTDNDTVRPSAHDSATIQHYLLSTFNVSWGLLTHESTFMWFRPGAISLSNVQPAGKLHKSRRSRRSHGLCFLYWNFQKTCWNECCENFKKILDKSRVKF